MRSGRARRLDGWGARERERRARGRARADAHLHARGGTGSRDARGRTSSVGRARVVGNGAAARRGGSDRHETSARATVKKRRNSRGVRNASQHDTLCLAKFGEIPTAKQSTTSVRMGKHTGRSGIGALRSAIGHSWSEFSIEKVRSWSEMVRSVTEFAKLRTGSAEITQSNPKTSRQTVNCDVLGDSVWT